MDRLRPQLRKFVWIVLLAFLGLAVAPTISRAIHLGEEGAGASSHQQMAAMSHHHGHDHHGGASDPAPRPTEHQHTLDHCGMCVVAAFAFALAATPPRVIVESVSGTAVMRPRLTAPRLRDDWSPATSRGPPPTA